MSLDLSRPIVCLITTGECEVSNYPAASQRLLEIAAAAIDAKVDLIQIREKRLSAKLIFELTQQVLRLTSGSQTKLVVNDRLDIALAAGADGVHLTSTSVPADIVRAHAPDGFLIGVSCHSIGEVAAATSGADFALYGPVFATPGKGDGVGLTNLKDVCNAAGSLPVLAIGGIDETNYREVTNAGAAGFAAIRALNDPASLENIIKELNT